MNEDAVSPCPAGASRTALVVETNNLGGGAADAGADARTDASLRRVMAALAAQSLPLADLAQLVVTHDGLDEATLAAVQRLAGRAVDFVCVEAGTGYYAAKNAGFAATDPARSDFVAFADSDCEPGPGWLAALLAPLSASSPPAVVAGRTTYAHGIVGSALSTIDFLYFPSPLAAGAVRNFYANNVVFRRDVFERFGYAVLSDVYRGHCQVLGLRLQAAGIALHHAAAAHTVHRLPDSWRETGRLRLLRGEDTHALTPHLVRTYLPAAWQWLGRSGPIGPLCALACRLRYSLAALGHQGLPALGRWRRLGAVACIVAFSALDAVGALVRGLGWRSRGAAAADSRALSYHRA